MREVEEKIAHNLTHNGMSWDFRYFKYTYKFRAPVYLKDIKDDGFVHLKTSVRDHLLMEFKMSLNTAIFGDPSGEMDKLLATNSDQMEELKKTGRIKTYREKFEDRLLRSLTDDMFSWTHKVVGGFEGPYHEWRSPEYINKDGVQIRFCDCMLGLGCYIDGVWSWNMSNNFFRKKVREVRKALRVMKKHLRNIENSSRESRMDNIISGI